MSKRAPLAVGLVTTLWASYILFEYLSSDEPKLVWIVLLFCLAVLGVLVAMKIDWARVMAVIFFSLQTGLAGVLFAVSFFHEAADLQLMPGAYPLMNVSIVVFMISLALAYLLMRPSVIKEFHT